MDVESAKEQTMRSSDRDIEWQDQPDPETDASRFSPTPLNGRIRLWLNQQKFRLLALGVLLLLPGLTLVTKLSGKATNGKTPAVISILPVETMQAKPVSSYQVSRTYTGEITALRTSELGFERSGKLEFIAVDEGKRVEAGTPLASLDTSNLEASRRELLAQRAQAVAVLAELKAGPRTEVIAAARASLRDLNEQLELARTKRDRREGLYTSGAISREQLDEVAFESSALLARSDEAKNKLEELVAGTRKEQIAAQAAVVERLNASLANVEIDIAKSTIKAPYTGAIAARRVDEGTVITAGQAVLRLVEDKSLEARIGIPVPTAQKLKLGSEQSVQIGQKTYQAKVSSLLPELDAPTRTLTVVLTLNTAAEVATGQVARLNLKETIPTSGYWLPTTALVRGVRGLWSCYVLAASPPEGATGAKRTFEVERRDVEILHTSSERVLVRGTIQPGDQVIANGTQRIVPGQLVSPAVKRAGGAGGAGGAEEVGEATL